VAAFGGELHERFSRPAFASFRRRITKDASTASEPDDSTGDSDGRTTMRVLSLATKRDVGIYRQQVRTLRESGVDVDTLVPPGNHGIAGRESRSPVDYLRFLPQVVGRSLDDYDLVHANFGLTAPMALAQLRLPVVLSLWGSDLHGPLGPVSRVCARFCDAVIVMSETMAADLGRDCHVVPHGIDFEKFRPVAKPEARERVGWDEAARHVLFPYAPDRTVKNYPRAERVVERTRDRVDAPVTLQTVSGVAHEQIPDYMNAADALLLPSEREGSPNTVKEALACNLPVVSTRVGDVPERLEGVTPSAARDRDADLVDALADVLADPRRSNGRETIRDLRLERTGERIREVYESVVRTGGPERTDDRERDSAFPPTGEIP
jgi:glycosyltransferase involved in cell wall biosynthesis